MWHATPGPMRSASVSASFKECQKKLLALRRHVAVLEGSGEPGTAKPENAAAEATLPAEQAAAELDELGATLAALLKAVGAGADMDLWRRKIATAQAEQRELSASLQAVAARRMREQEEEMAKKALLERRYDMDSVRLDREYKINAAADNSVSRREGDGKKEAPLTCFRRCPCWASTSKWDVPRWPSSGGSARCSTACTIVWCEPHLPCECVGLTFSLPRLTQASQWGCRSR